MTTAMKELCIIISFISKINSDKFLICIRILSKGQRGQTKALALCKEILYVVQKENKCIHIL